MKRSSNRSNSNMLLTTLRALLLTTILLAQLASPGPGRAQSTSIRFDTLSVENGLSQSTVRTIFQDSDGFMWFGTDDGLNKYDGYNFTIYKHDPENPASLVDNSITAIFQDSQTDLWIGTANGLDRFKHDTETFQHFQHDPKKPNSLLGAEISAIAEDRQGNFWIGMLDGGLSRFNYISNSFTNYPHDPKNLNSPASTAVNSLAADQKDNRLWIGTSDGLDVLDLKTNRFTHFKHDPEQRTSLSDNQVQSLFQDRVGTLWIGTVEGGLNRFNSTAGTFTSYQSRPSNPYTISSNLVRAIYEDKSGHLWVGGRNGLDQFNRSDEYFTHNQHDPNDQHSLSNDAILSIYADRAGVLWIGTFGGGVSKYVQNNERFALYQHRPGVLTSLSNDVVYAIYEDRENVVWVGTMDGGLNRLDQEAGTFYAYQNNPSDPASINSNDIRAIYEDHRGVLWVGTYGGGLNRFEKDAGHFTHYTHDDNYPDTISDNRITAIFEDQRGNLWIGTRGGGLDLMDSSTGRFIHFRYNAADPTSLSSDYIHMISEDHAGSLWIATDHGISVMDPNTRRFQRYLNDPRNALSLSDDRVQSILETSDGIIWIGTLLGGLERFDRTTRVFRHYTQKQGLSSDAIYGILADRNGNLWLSTNRGLSRFDIQTETFRNYDRQDGLQSYEFNPGAYYQNSRGRMYFGGIQGFNAFDPSQVEDNALAPQIVITAFKKFNQTDRKDLTGGEKINLSYQDNFVSFEFAALDYSAPEKNQYAYKLEGFDKNWIYAGTRRYASYTNLRGGNYTFRVIGSNQDGVWNETGASIEITVVPPFWENWWFIGTVALFLAGSAAASYRLRIKRIQSQNQNLEEQIWDRTKEIERRRQVAEGLREILTILNSNRSLKESLDAIILQVERLMGTRAVVIFRYGEEGAPCIVASNLFPMNGKANPQSMMLLPTWLTLPILEGKILSLPDITEQRQDNPDLFKTPFGRYAALLAVPLVVNDKTDGGLVLLYDWAREFAEEDCQMAASFADHTAMAIANAQLRSQAEEIAVSAERSRLARDLHDAVTQTLFATSLIAEVLPKLWERSPDAAKMKVTELRELTRGALAEMRTLLMELRPTALMDVPLPELLQQLCEAFTGRVRIPVALAVQSPVVLPANVKIGFYRIAQESLNNIQKHARATQVSIQLLAKDGQVILSIHDDGIGFERTLVPPNHFGLGIMGERANSIGAQFSVDSQPGEGTSISVTWQEEQEE